MDSTDRREFDRLYTRLLGKWSRPQQHADELNLAELQALMDRIGKEEERETDRMNPADIPVGN
jgi:hypothetical protein